MKEREMVEAVEMLLRTSESDENKGVRITTTYESLSLLRASLETELERERFLQRLLDGHSRKNEESLLAVLHRRMLISTHRGTKKYGLPFEISKRELDGLNRMMLNVMDWDEAVEKRFPIDLQNACKELNERFYEESGYFSEVYIDYMRSVER